MSSNPLVNSVKNHLASNHMFADEEWIAGCVEYLTEDSSNNYSEREILSLAKEQWLLNDLKEICPGSLPANLKNQQKTMLTGRFVLQINAALDIGTPAYQQYLKLQKVNMENIEATINYEDKVSSHRMIKLYLTDGVQELSAIEYKSMRNLSCDIKPGSKVLIKGPIECRRGVLLLTENAVELLGGEVEEIATSNSLAGLLSSKLGVQLSIQEADQNTTIHQPRHTNIPTPHTQMPPPRPGDAVEPSRPIAIVTGVQAVDVPTNRVNDDDIDLDQLAAIEAQLYDNPTKTSKRPLPPTADKPEKKQKIDTKNSIHDYPDDNDLFFEDDEYLREIEAKFDEKERLSTAPAYPVAVCAEPFVYIKQINQLSDSEKAGRVFRVKGQIMKLLSKLSVGKDGWSLKCTIVDGTGSIDVDFTSAVLSKLVGFTPQEMNELKKQMATKPELKEKAISALQNAKDTLQVLYCIIELTMLEVPKITCLIPYDDTHVYLLKRRTRDTVL